MSNVHLTADAYPQDAVREGCGCMEPGCPDCPPWTLDTCADCGAPLADTDSWLCSACITARDEANLEAEAFWASDPLGFGAWRDHQMEHQSAYSLPAAIILIATMLAGLVLYGGWQDAQADDTTQPPAASIVAPYPVNGRVYWWPVIGTEAFSRSCKITQWWEDGSAIAFCKEDGSSWTFSPEEYEWHATNETR